VLPLIERFAAMLAELRVFADTFGTAIIALTVVIRRF
jgi:membrane protein insertase Oxa1/YidC/SpoIIIJ